MRRLAVTPFLVIVPRRCLIGASAGNRRASCGDRQGHLGTGAPGMPGDPRRPIMADLGRKGDIDVARFR